MQFFIYFWNIIDVLEHNRCCRKFVQKDNQNILKNPEMVLRISEIILKSELSFKRSRFITIPAKPWQYKLIVFSSSCFFIDVLFFLHLVFHQCLVFILSNCAYLFLLLLTPWVTSFGAIFGIWKSLVEWLCIGGGFSFLKGLRCGNAHYDSQYLGVLYVDV